MLKKIKFFMLETEKGKGILNIAIVLLAGTSSFFLGRLSKSDLKPGIEIEYPKVEIHQEAAAISAISPQKTVKGPYFASSRGKKYYPASCSAGKSIKLENRVYFQSPEEAVGAGYELSASCR